MINEELVFIDMSLKSQTEVFHFLAQASVEKGVSTNEKQVYDALIKREAEGTTGMMDGFAIPYAKSNAVIKPAIIIIKLTKGIDWDSLDGKATQYIITLFIPTDESGITHLKVLSQVARMLMKEEFKAQFIQSRSKEDLNRLISNKIEGEN